MQDTSSRIGRTFSILVTVYLIQALSLSTVYAAVISGPSYSQKNEFSLIKKLSTSISIIFDNEQNNSPYFLNPHISPSATLFNFGRNDLVTLTPNAQFNFLHALKFPNRKALSCAA